MKVNIGGKRYDSTKCKTLGDTTQNDYSNNQSSTDTLLQASDGTLLLHHDTTGNDCHDCNDRLTAISKEDAVEFLDGRCNQTEEEVQACLEIGLLTIVA